MGTSTPALTGQEQRILAGGVPDFAAQRLKELTSAGMTSSFVSVADAAVAALAGIEPVGQLVGASACVLLQGIIRRTRGPRGRLPAGSAVWRERDGPIRSWGEARRRALTRLSEQARVLGADAVLGVVPEIREHKDRVEVVFTGTAVRDHTAHGSKSADPVLGMVSVAEYRMLRDAGTDVLGIVGSCSSVGVTPSLVTERAIGGRLTGGRANRELKDLSEGVYEARRLAIERLRAEAAGLKATGVIGADLASALTEHDGPGHHVGLTVQLFGTAVRVRAHSGLSPRPVVNMSSRARG